MEKIFIKNARIFKHSVYLDELETHLQGISEKHIKFDLVGRTIENGKTKLFLYYFFNRGNEEYGIQLKIVLKENGSHLIESVMIG
ncbi:MAG: hypothetical protein GY705_26190 [Bacteroidetes bacterium]|nr:hypothetical protein [Bacteroidota bacterium]